MLEEFKKFALKGNVLDLAIGVVVGGAFGQIVTSLVNDIIMPIVGIIIGGINFTMLEYAVNGRGEEPIIIKYGQFIQSTFDFLVISFSIFMFIKAINSFRTKEEKQETEEEVVVELTKEELLLGEIRDILKENAKA